MQTNLEKIKAEAESELAAAKDAADIERWRNKFLGRKEGAVVQILRGLAQMPIDRRKAVGEAANSLKVSLEEALAAKEVAVKREVLAGQAESSKLDVTLPGAPPAIGRYHPITQTMREIVGAFSTMGFQAVEGPEVELDYYNFEALNIPKGHPARDMFDTFWVDYKNDKGERAMLLRTHTSPMQIRVMEKQKPPVRVVVPGKVFRYEATDATHESVFHQVEGLAVDDNLSLADLKGTLYEFARRLFGADRKVRFRCDYFPFVEPGVDMAIDCFNCGGKGCRICKETGWLEIMGAGMVHPSVLERVGYDSKQYTGFAFGIGVERVAMLKYGIDDIRHFYANDMRFLRQF